MAEGRPTTTQKVLMGVLAVLVLYGMVKSASRPETTQTAPEPELEWYQKEDRIGAYVAVQGFVKQRLRSPQTASFPASNNRVTYEGSQTYKVDSYVDAQNAFGADIRTQFTATVRQQEEDSWVLESIEFE